MRRTAAALALVVACGVPATALAEGPSVTVSGVQPDAAQRRVTATVTGTGLPAGVGLDPSSVVVRVAGRTLPTTALVGETDSTATTPDVLVVVDTSGSMQGQPMEDAKQAVSAFLTDAPADAEVGLLRFSTSPELLVPPTRDRTRLLGAVSALQAQGETALYDAVLAGLRALGGSGDRRLVVLSDGGDTRSTAQLAQVLEQARASGVVVDAVGFGTDEAVGDVLRQITSAGRGTVRRASNAAELSSALTTTTLTTARTLTLEVLLPPDLRGEQRLEVRVAAAGTPLTATAALPLAPPTVARTAVPAGQGRTVLLAGLAAIALSLVLGSLALLTGGRRDERKVKTVLDRYTTTAAPAAVDLRTASPVVRTALDLADRVATKRGLQDRLTSRLDQAAVTLTPAEWLLLRAGVAVATALLLVLLGSGLVVAFLLGALVGTAVPALVLRVRGRRRQRAFDDKLPDALQMVAGSLSAGYSLAQSLDGIVREGSEPLATEIGRALAESRLGVPVETTLDGVADRMESRDFRWVVMAIRVQREVGGNLAGVLTTVSATMRERAMLRRHVRGLSAEGRLSAYILIGLPVFLALYMVTLRREYIAPLYTTALGVVLVVVAVLLLSIGSFWMSRMVKVEV